MSLVRKHPENTMQVVGSGLGLLSNVVSPEIGFLLNTANDTLTYAANQSRANKNKDPHPQKFAIRGEISSLLTLTSSAFFTNDLAKSSKTIFRLFEGVQSISLASHIAFSWISALQNHASILSSLLGLLNPLISGVYHGIRIDKVHRNNGFGEILPSKKYHNQYKFRERSNFAGTPVTLNRLRVLHTQLRHIDPEMASTVQLKKFTPRQADRNTLYGIHYNKTNVIGINDTLPPGSDRFTAYHEFAHHVDHVLKTQSSFSHTAGHDASFQNYNNIVVLRAIGHGYIREQDVHYLTALQNKGMPNHNLEIRKYLQWRKQQFEDQKLLATGETNWNHFLQQTPWTSEPPDRTILPKSMVLIRNPTGPPT